MLTISFIFRPGRSDDEFRRLHAATQAAAESTRGCLGPEAWWSDDRSACNAGHDWDDRRQLSDLSAGAHDG